MHRRSCSCEFSSSFGLGEWVLVTAAAGGIGMSAVQIAKGMRKNRSLSEHAALLSC